MVEERSKKRASDKLLDTGTPQDPIAFGNYEIVGKIGRGGMANVYHGHLTGVPARRLAIKCMRPKIAQEQRFVEMFSRETKLALLLRHPGIVRSIDAGEARDRLFIAMEYIPGQDLAAILRRCQKNGRRLPVPHALYIIASVARALDYAHKLRGPTGQPLNIVNRDVSPSNIRVSYEGDVKLLDFGIAQAAVQVTSEIGVLKGKFAYMSPEQIRGLPVDPRSDIFSLGSVAHEILTGERLFRGESEFSLMEKVRGEVIRPPSAFDKRIPPEVDAVVMGMLERELAKRIADAGQIAEAIDPILKEYQFQAIELGHFLRKLYPMDFRREAKILEALGTMASPEGGDEEPVSPIHRQEKVKRRRPRVSSASSPVGQERVSARTLLFAAAMVTLAAVIMIVVALI